MTFSSKETARAFGRRTRSDWDRETREGFSNAIAQHLINAPLFQSVDTILTYVGSRNEELDTRPIIQSALQAGKQVLVPLTRAAGRMEWSLLTDMTDLERTGLGLQEPRKESLVLCEEAAGLCIVPGLLFNENGHRIGFGGGYYDRYLPGHEGATVGLCPSDCYGHHFPVIAHDQPVDWIITEMAVIDLRHTRQSAPNKP